MLFSTDFPPSDVTRSIFWINYKTIQWGYFVEHVKVNKVLFKSTNLSESEHLVRSIVKGQRDLCQVGVSIPVSSKLLHLLLCRNFQICVGLRSLTAGGLHISPIRTMGRHRAGPKRLTSPFSWPDDPLMLGVEPDITGTGKFQKHLFMCRCELEEAGLKTVSLNDSLEICAPK